MNYLDDTFSQYAEAFVGNRRGEGDIPHREKLNTPAFDYTINSLHEVDQYLNFLFSNNIDQSGIEYQNVVIWCGAYIGEVIRKNAQAQYHWVHYEEYMKERDPGARNLIPYTLGTHALLVSAEAAHMTLPVNKVARYLAEGEDNNVHYYASGDIEKSNKKLGIKSPQTKSWWKFWD
jgi:hypothetical protein